MSNPPLNCPSSYPVYVTADFKALRVHRSLPSFVIVSVITTFGIFSLFPHLLSFIFSHDFLF